MCSCAGGESAEAPDADVDDEKEAGDELSTEFAGDESQLDPTLWSDSPRESTVADRALLDSSSAAGASTYSSRLHYY